VNAPKICGLMKLNALFVKTKNVQPALAIQFVVDISQNISIEKFEIVKK